HDRTGGQHLDLEFAAGHVVDFLGEVDRVLVDDVDSRPGTLESQGGCALCAHDAWEAARGGGTGGGGAAGDPTPRPDLGGRIGGGLGGLLHGLSPATCVVCRFE